MTKSADHRFWWWSFSFWYKVFSQIPTAFFLLRSGCCSISRRYVCHRHRGWVLLGLVWDSSGRLGKDNRKLVGDACSPSTWTKAYSQYTWNKSSKKISLFIVQLVRFQVIWVYLFVLFFSLFFSPWYFSTQLLSAHSYSQFCYCAYFLPR